MSVPSKRGTKQLGRPRPRLGADPQRVVEEPEQDHAQQADDRQLEAAGSRALCSARIAKAADAR